MHFRSECGDYRCHRHVSLLISRHNFYLLFCDIRVASDDRYPSRRRDFLLSCGDRTQYHNSERVTIVILSNYNATQFIVGECE